MGDFVIAVSAAQLSEPTPPPKEHSSKLCGSEYGRESIKNFLPETG